MAKKKPEDTINEAYENAKNTDTPQLHIDLNPWGDTNPSAIFESTQKAWLNYWTGVMNSFWGTGNK